MEEVLVVDGYNIIGASQQLKQLKEEGLEEARDWLIDRLSEYQGYTGIKVYLIFDAHMVPGIGKKLNQYKIDIIFTKENETADERIERLVIQLKRIQRQIYVATSDHTEQWVVFGQGALRKSARELINEMNHIEKNIHRSVSQNYQKKNFQKFPISREVAEIFERMRRGK